MYNQWGVWPARLGGDKAGQKVPTLGLGVIFSLTWTAGWSLSSIASLLYPQLMSYVTRAYYRPGGHPLSTKSLR